ncbi:Uncharacterised protein [Alistipes sp. cv1]|nr:Uncharacterised protein [Faecalibacterium prausnitzii]
MFSARKRFARFINALTAADCKICTRFQHCLMHFFQILRFHRIIRIHKCDPISLCCIQTRIAGCAYTAVLLMDHPHAAVPFCCCIAQGRAVVW